MSARTIKDGPFCWQSKEALRAIHDAFSESNTVLSATGIYVALTVLASDQQAEAFEARKALIAYRAGVSVRTAGTVLAKLEALGILQVKRKSSYGGAPDGPSTYTLLRVGIGRAPVGNDCMGVGIGCAPVGNERIQGSVADKVEESEKNLPEESKKKSISPPSAASFRVSVEVVEEIYKAYPRKEKPIPAKKAIGKALKIIAGRETPDPGAWLLGRVRAYAKSRKDEDAKFTPHPATWFNDGSYDDEIAAGAIQSQPRLLPSDWPQFLEHLAETYPQHAEAIRAWDSWEMAKQSMHSIEGDYHSWKRALTPIERHRAKKRAREFPEPDLPLPLL